MQLVQACLPRLNPQPWVVAIPFLPGSRYLQHIHMRNIVTVSFCENSFPRFYYTTHCVKRNKIEPPVLREGIAKMGIITDKVMMRDCLFYA